VVSRYLRLAISQSKGREGRLESAAAEKMRVHRMIDRKSQAILPSLTSSIRRIEADTKRVARSHEIGNEVARVGEGSVLQTGRDSRDDTVFKLLETRGFKDSEVRNDSCSSS
jgi:hypothetical protein